MAEHARVVQYIYDPPPTHKAMFSFAESKIIIENNNCHCVVGDRESMSDYRGSLRSVCTDRHVPPTHNVFDSARTESKTTYVRGNVAFLKKPAMRVRDNVYRDDAYRGLPVR